MTMERAENPPPPQPRPIAPPRLLVPWASPWQNFLESWQADWNTPRNIHFSPRHSPFWHDVFVHRPLPKQQLALSYVLHGLVAALLWAVPTMLPYVARPDAPEIDLKDTPITYYKLSPYLPALRSTSAPALKESKGQPRLARQPIVSLPANADNLEQTIVDPRTVKVLPKHVDVPNLVVWTPTAGPAPIANNPALPSRLTLPSDVRVVAPPAETTAADVPRAKVPNLPQPSVVEPPSSTVDLKLPVRDLNIAATTPTVEAPELVIRSSRSVASMEKAQNTPDGAAPAASAFAAGGNGQQAIGQLIAMSLDPTLPKGPLAVPGGNRRGTFAAGPDGRADAPGTPDIKGGGTGAGGKASGGNGGADQAGDRNALGLTIGGGPAAPSATAVVAAAAPPPTLTPKPPPAARNAKNVFLTPHQTVADLARATTPQQNVDEPGASSLEKQIFGGKRFYSMILNLPNLTSSGGSWIVRFAELHESRDRTSLSAPVAVDKFDPAYPADAIRDKVEGTVTVYAVIRADGTVSDVRVLRGIDSRLDDSARSALAKWRFAPATKNGIAVDLEAVVQIPFKLKKKPWE